MKTRILLAALAAFLLLPPTSVTAYAGGGDSTSCPETAQEQSIIDITPREDTTSGTVTISDNIAADAPEETAEPTGEPAAQEPTDTAGQPFTPSGTGTVVDNATSEDGKEFYTIVTPAENTFYLVIDRQRSSDNVYFLNAVTEADLLALAEVSAPPATPEPVEPSPSTEPEPQAEPEPAKKGMGPLPLVLLILLCGGGAGWYFKIYKPKQEQADSDDDFGEAEGDLYDMDGADPYGGDPDYDGWPEEDADPLDIYPEDDSPPWDDGDEE